MDDDDPVFVPSAPSSPLIESRFYKYERLGPYEIRVLQILPSEDDILRLRLYSTTLRTFPNSPWSDGPDSSGVEYAAISYTWGDETKDRVEIVVNGKAMYIGANCYAAIRQLQPLQDKHKNLWIDAICIDQASLEEKNEQVQVMAEIFRQADKVFCCIGPHAGGSRFLCKVIREFHTRNILVRNETPRVLFELLNLDGPKYPQLAQGRGTLVLSLESAQRAHAALVALATREYFQRLWIVQELTVARSVSIACGDDVLELHQLKNFVCYLSCKRFWPLFGSNFELPERVVTKLKAINKRRSDVSDHALWAIEGTEAFARPSLRALPMLVAFRTRDEYQRVDVTNAVCNPYTVTDNDLRTALSYISTDVGTERVPYLVLVERLQEWGCSEVRDMLFGLINISWFPKWCPADVKPRPDYASSVLSVAMEAARVADYVDEYDTTAILGRIALLCRVFRLSFEHPDIQDAIRRRRERSSTDLREPDPGADIWAQKYEVACSSQVRSVAALYARHFLDVRPVNGEAVKALVRWPDNSTDMGPIFFAGHHIRSTDFLLQLPIGSLQYSKSASEDFVWLVVRQEGKYYDVIGQAFAETKDMQAEPLRLQQTGINRCTLDLEDLIVMYCQLQHWREQRHQGAYALAGSLGFLNHDICRTAASTWTS